MADQCIVCLEDLDVSENTAVTTAAADPDDAGGGLIPESSTTHPGKLTTTSSIALIKPCNHVLHDDCLKMWSEKANSCPICRQTFNVVEILDKVGGTTISEYAVEDKKQVAEFDPTDYIEDDANDLEDETPCLVCGGTDNDDTLLLCDGCDSPYHTFCIDLERVPRGNWFCPECASEGAYAAAAEIAAASSRRGVVPHSASRTLQSLRQSRQHRRHDAWLGSWNRVSSTIHDLSGFDLDFSEDDSEMYSFRRLQRRAEQSDRQFREWQSRLRIAGRQGAGEQFRRAVPAEIQSVLPPVNPDEDKSWGAFEKAKELDNTSPRNRKRKSRSVTASPIEPPTEPERKLKRPRTRRVIDKPESSSASPTVAGPSRPPQHSPPPTRPQTHVNGEPSFLSSLLKEVEMSTSDDDTSRSGFSGTTVSIPNRRTSPPLDFSSPAASPSPVSSTYHTPRALSITPPPHISRRPGSPLPLSSRVEPHFPPTRYSPNRVESNHRSEEANGSLEIRQPRPLRRQVHLPRSEEVSPVRATMSAEAKEGINKIVKTALAPHWKGAEITKEQYADINRDVSRKLYEIVADRNVADERQKSAWETFASTEVASAVKSLTTST